MNKRFAVWNTSGSVGASLPDWFIPDGRDFKEVSGLVHEITHMYGIHFNHILQIIYLI